MRRKAITASTTFCELRSSIFELHVLNHVLSITLPVCERSRTPPIRKGNVAPATVTVEFLPGALRLGEPVSDGVDSRWVMAEAAVAAIDLDVLGLGPVLVQAALPGADAIGTAEEGGCRHRRQLGQRFKRILVFGLAAPWNLI